MSVINTPKVQEGWLFLYHPTTGGTHVAPESSFEDVWEANGWLVAKWDEEQGGYIVPEQVAEQEKETSITQETREEQEAMNAVRGQEGDNE